MPLESVTHISDLVVTNPTSTDPKSEGDNHLRAIKTALKTDFPNISGPVTKTHTQLNNALDKTGDTMTGPLAQAAGTAALPSYTFTGDTNTGIYSPGADQVAVSIGGAQALTIDASRNVLVTGSGGLGYGTGSGGSVSQATSRTTGVTLNKPSGAITLVSAAGSTTWQSFTLTNSSIAAVDTVEVVQRAGTDLYEINVTAVAAGSCRITFRTTGGTTTETPLFTFNVTKGAAS